MDEEAEGGAVVGLRDRVPVAVRAVVGEGEVLCGEGTDAVEEERGGEGETWDR